MHPLNNSLASKFRNLGNIPQNQIMRVQQKVGNVGGHFTLLERSKDHGIRNWGDGCCRLDGAFCSLWRHDHISDVLMYFARDTWDISFPCLFLNLLAHWLLSRSGCAVSGFFVLLHTVLHINIRFRGIIVL